jgi:hypothetical protein
MARREERRTGGVMVITLRILRDEATTPDEVYQQSEKMS